MAAVEDKLHAEEQDADIPMFFPHKESVYRLRTEACLYTAILSISYSVFAHAGTTCELALFENQFTHR